VRLARDLGGELSGEPRLADAGLAREQDDLAGAGPGLAQAVAQQGALRRPADEVGEPAARRLEAAFRHGNGLDREGFDRLGEALHCLAAELAQPEKVADQAAGGAGEDDLPGFGKSLQARCKVGGLPDHRLLLRRALADQIADHDQPGGNADADGEPLHATGLQAPDRRCYLQPSPHRTLGVVFMRPRIAEIGQNPVAHVFGDKPVIARDDGGNGVLIGADLLAQFLRVEARRQWRRADEIAEHHRQLPPLGGVVRRRTGRCGQAGDGSEKTLAVPERHPKLLEIGVGQLRQDIGVDFTRAKQRLVLSEAETSQPTPDIHGRTPRGLERIIVWLNRPVHSRTVEELDWVMMIQRDSRSEGRLRGMGRHSYRW
jgi:hypothetical protein